MSDARRPGRRSMTHEDAELVRAAMREILKKNKWSRRRLGDEIGITGQAISQILGGTNRPDRGHVPAIARLLGKQDWQLLNRPAPTSPERFIEYEDRYPELAKAVRAAREMGYPTAAIEMVASARLKGGDHPKGHWLHQIELETAILERDDTVAASNDTSAADAVTEQMTAARDKAKQKSK